MKIKLTRFKGLKVFQGKTYLDSRGAFRELFLKNKTQSFQSIFWCMSKSKKNVIRGLHIQKRINQAKFVSVVKGRIFDVALDLRKNSKTFGKIFKIVLSEKNCLSLYIPEGFAHAYYSYEKSNIIYYKLTNYYKPKFEDGINLLDNTFKIKWPKKKLNISKKDKNLGSFKDFIKNYKFL